MPRVLFLVLLGLLLLPLSATASTSGVVISQIYGGGGNSGAAFRNDYVELFNAGSAPVDVTGWTIQYSTAAGTTWQTTPVSGTIAAGHYYLVQLASSAAVGAALPIPDASGTTNLAATSGKIALVRDAAALTCGASAGSCSSSATVEDLVGYGDASDFEGAGTAPAASNTLAALRGGDGCFDTNENATDFAAGTPDPRNSAAAARACASTPAGGASASVNVDVDVASVLSVALDRPALSFGTAAAGATPPALSENVTVSSNNATGYSLAVRRTAFSPKDLPLALGVGSGALSPIPVAPATALTIGTKDGPSAAGGDLWATRIGFSSPLPLVSTGRYSATVTFTVLAR